MLSAWLLVSLCLLFIELAPCESKVIDLNGDEWTISDSLGKLLKPLSARVPGQVHLDLLRAGVIEDPYAHWNDWLYQWIGYDDWTYSRKFEMLDSDLEKTIWLKCDGLDTIATISINDVEVGYAENYHRRYKFNITHEVQAGTNSIKVAFKSAANYTWKAAAAYPYDLYTDIQGVFFNKSQRGFARKTQSDFGWDWGPGFVPCGIWRNISIEVFDHVYVLDVVPKTSYNDTEESYYMSVTVCLHVVTEPSKPLVVNIEARTNTSREEFEVMGHFDVRVSGESCGTVTSKAISPEVVEKSYLWWPLGIRWPQTKEKADLIEVSARVEVMSGEEEVTSTTVTKNVGFRNIELVQNPVGVNGSDGETFFFQMRTADTVYPFYCKGSNFIPMDAFVNRATPEHAKKLLTAFVEGNQNMLRVWGGGLYQPDWFYDLCDEMGIMVWQEFMFADALYPRNEAFLRNVELEIRDAVRRLGHHPSIVLWSGNNENQGILGNDTVRIVDYTVLYDEIIRTTLWEEDRTRIYWPSSPSNGILVDNPDTKMFIQKWGDVGDTRYGDIHRYDYTDNCMDVSNFPRPRFVSEFGFQSYPSYGSFLSITDPEDRSNDSPFMNHRNHHPTGNKQMENLIKMTFKLPVNNHTEFKFRDFIYLSQVTQALCIRAQAEHYRRLLSEEGAYTRGTLYWQLNDIWQAQTWSSVQWTGQWKVLHYYMRRAYAPILVSAYQEESDHLNAYVVLDVANHEISYSLEVTAVSYATGKPLNTITKSGLKSAGFTGLNMFNESLKTVFKEASPSEGFIIFKVISDTDSETLATNWHFPTKLSEVDLPAVTFTVSEVTRETEGEVDILKFGVSASAVAVFVYLDSTLVPGVFMDNGFHMLPGVSMEVVFTTFKPAMDVETFKSGMAIRTIQETYSSKPYSPIKFGGMNTYSRREI